MSRIILSIKLKGNGGGKHTLTVLRYEEMLNIYIDERFI